MSQSPREFPLLLLWTYHFRERNVTGVPGLVTVRALLPFVHKMKSRSRRSWPCLVRVTPACGRVGVAQATAAGRVCTSNLSLPALLPLLQYDLTSRTWTFLGSTCTRRLSVCPRTLATHMHSGERVCVCCHCAALSLLSASESMGATWDLQSNVMF